MSIRTWPQFSARRLMSRRRRGVIWSAAHTCPSPASVTCALLERAMSGCRSTTYRESTQPFSSELDLDAGAAQGARLNVIHFFAVTMKQICRHPRRARIALRQLHKTLATSSPRRPMMSASPAPAAATSAEQRLKELGIQLPPPPRPFGAYVEAVQTGRLLFLSGMLPTEGRGVRFIGRVGAELDVEAGRKAAYLAAINGLAAAREH